VKDLRIGPPPRYDNNYKISISPWRTLFSQARIAPLLPNLRSLKLQTTPHSYGHTQLMWITAFASPSLCSIEAGYASTAPDGAQLSFTSMSLIMKLVSERCPQLETLALFPGAIQKGNSTMVEEEDDGEHSTLALMWEKPFYCYLASTQNLRSLTANTTLLNPKPLEMLSQLPSLEYLDLYPLTQGHSPNGVLPVDLPEAAFPALRHLNLRLLCTDTLDAIWNMEPIVRNLTRLGLYFDFYGPDVPLYTIEWLAGFFTVLCDLSPHITNLTIDLDGTQLGEMAPHTAEFSLFKQLAQLPLRHLYLHCLVSKPEDSRLLYESLGTFWPKLTRLRIPDQTVRVDELRYFATLPDLQYLSVNLKCPKDWSPPALPEPGSQALVSSSLHTLEQENFMGDLFWDDHLKPIAK
jgi:hypothetical protein